MDNTTTNVQGREIKFKVWEIAEKRFVDYYSMGDGFVHVAIGDQYYLSNNLNAPEEHKESLRKQNIEIKDEFILLQFTGLRDKSGKEIYESDVVKVQNWNPKVFQTEFIEAPVVFMNGSFHLQTRAGLHLLYDTQGAEVTGNIYEHPHLLKTEGLVVSEGLIDNGV